jgi:hypothetical protein
VKRKRLLALLVAALVGMPGFAAALSTDAIEAHVGMLTIGTWTPPDNGFSPPIYLVGASTMIALDGLPEPWVLGLGVDFIGTWYLWNDIDRRAELAEPVDGGSFFTVGLLVSPRIGTRFSLGKAVAMGGYAGFDLLIRFPFSPFSGVSILDDQLPALGYFLAGRFLYPELGAWLTWQAAKDVQIAFGVRSLWPVYRIWSPEVNGFSTFFHQVILAGTLGMTIPLGKPATIGSPAADATEPATEPAAP